MDAPEVGKGQLVLIRHAPADHGGRLCGRTDVPALLNAQDIAAVRNSIPDVAEVITSPALRCRETADALFPGNVGQQDEALWEQDFGDHEGLAFAELPDLGPLSSQQLADYAPPNGESFSDLCRRISRPLHGYAVASASGSIALVVHAGVIRGALAILTDNVPGALSFEIGTLSVTRLRAGPDGLISVMDVNRMAHSVG